jgi:hypothetical protein
MTFAIPNGSTLWKGSDFTSKKDVTLTLDRAAVDAILPDMRRLAAREGAVTDIPPEDMPTLPFADQVEQAREILVSGRGMVILSGFPVEDLGQREIETFYWVVGHRLGTPVSQSVLGDRLGHVMDVSGKDVTARAYRNSNELTPHSDPGDLLSFLCLRPAMRGGESLFASSHMVHEIMREERPDLLARLYRGYHWHRFGEQPDGFDPITPRRVPVFSEKDGLLSCRIVRQYIEIAADEDPACALDDVDREALDMFDALAAREDVAFRFTLAAGEAILANNYTVLHARTAFEDGPTEAEKRHLLRLWLRTDPPRPVAPDVYIYGPGVFGIPPKAGAQPVYQHRVTVN